MSDKLEYDVVASIVLYKHSKEEILKLAKDFFDNSQGLKRKLCLVDNSPEKSDYSKEESDILEYQHTGHNGGYGYGHNKAISSNQGKTKYHIVLNPDLELKDNVISNLYKEMEANKDIGLCSPTIANSDGSNQYQPRKLPSFSYILRRGSQAFIPQLKPLFKKENDNENLKKFADGKKPFIAPFISGCFMFMRGTHLNKVKGFDEKYFMYYEDYDLARRFAKAGKNVVFPKYKVTHDWQRSSTKSVKLLKAHVTSMMRYFSTYGFFKDKERNKINDSISTFESKYKGAIPKETNIYSKEQLQEVRKKVTTNDKDIDKKVKKIIKNSPTGKKRVNTR